MATTGTWKLQAGAALFAMALMSGLVLRVSAAAFTAETDNAANSWDTGSIALGTDATTQMFNVTGMLPGQTETRCITVTYTGDTDPGPVKLYASVTDGGLGPHLDITVTEATETGGTGSTCGTLSATTVIAPSQTLNAFGSYADYSSGAGAWDPAATGETKTYKFDVTLGADTPSTAQGGSADATFTWQTTT